MCCAELWAGQNNSLYYHVVQMRVYSQSLFQLHIAATQYKSFDL